MLLTLLSRLQCNSTLLLLSLTWIIILSSRLVSRFPLKCLQGPLALQVPVAPWPDRLFSVYQEYRDFIL